MKQKLYRIQPRWDSSAHDVYADKLQEIADGPEEIVQVLMLDAPLPTKPILLVITNPPPRASKQNVETRG